MPLIIIATFFSFLIINTAQATPYHELVLSPSYAPDEYVTTWETYVPPGTTDNRIAIALDIENSSSVVVDWGDGAVETNVTLETPSHLYAEPGIYEIKISGGLTYFTTLRSYGKLLSVEQWGSTPWSYMGEMFRGAQHIVFNALDVPDLSNVASMYRMFFGASSFNSNINNWDVSNIIDMHEMFSSATAFNQPLNDWDTSSVTNMSEMFHYASAFNQPLDNWDVSNVIDMGSMFWGATAFNQNINTWDTGNVTSTGHMFANASSFNQPLDQWDVSNVTYTTAMFEGAASFNQNINTWNTESLISTAAMFAIASSFNQPLNNWDTSNVTDTREMFRGARVFNQPLDNWDTSNVTDMSSMFDAAWVFNQPLDSWDTSNVTTMSDMFYYAAVFNQSLNIWDTSNVTDMSSMFYGAREFNQQLNGWDTNNVTTMAEMFAGAMSFDQSLASWDVSNVTDMTNIFGGREGDDPYYDAILSSTNYDATLSAWSGLTLQGNVTFNARGSYYCEAENARESIITNFNWTIIDEGKECPIEFEESDLFITTWQTDNPGFSYGSVSLSADEDYSYRYYVDWGDGNTDMNVKSGISHDYAEPGVYTVKIAGDYPQFGASHLTKLLSVEQWGTIQWETTEYMFSEALNVVINATDIPDLSSVSSMERMFYDISSINSNINNWDVSNVTNMNGTFWGVSSFNQPLNNWDVSNVTDMRGIFWGATSFNQPLNNWDTSNVTDMRGMFGFASSFNQPLNNWDTSNVTGMTAMFGGASSFNQPLNNWDVSNVTDMSEMFTQATSFNQPLNNWDTSNVTGMTEMFSQATSFNQPLNNWDVSNTTNMLGMFSSAENFDQSLGSWDVSNATDMRYMFGNYDELIENAMGDTPYSEWPEYIRDMYGLPLSGLSVENYDDTLNSWSQLDLLDDIIFDGGTSQFCDAEGERQSIISDFGWTINDAGNGCITPEEETPPTTTVATTVTTTPAHVTTTPTTTPTPSTIPSTAPAKTATTTPGSLLNFPGSSTDNLPVVKAEEALEYIAKAQTKALAKRDVRQPLLGNYSPTNNNAYDAILLLLLALAVIAYTQRQKIRDMIHREKSVISHHSPPKWK